MLSAVGKELVPYDASKSRFSSPSSSDSLAIDSGQPSDDDSVKIDQSSDSSSSSDSDSSSGTLVSNNITGYDRIEPEAPDAECVRDVLEDHRKYPPLRQPADVEVAIEDSDVDIISLPDESAKRRTNNPVGRKRKTLSPTPKQNAYKQPRLNHSIAVVESSVESGDDRGATKRPYRRKLRDVGPDDLKDDELMDELALDQVKYPPQHNPGQKEDYLATETRIKYFNEVFDLKVGKYAQLNMFRSRNTVRVMPLALSISGFMQYYWPGKVICCGLTRESLSTLEKHVSRSHRPPKNPPVFTLIRRPENSEDSDVPSKNETTSKSKCPAGFMADQNKFLPQHKPGDPEDFSANEESISYFMEVLKVKQEKYGSMAPIKDKPLSGNYSDFILNYWPGIVSCCHRIHSSCKEFHSHFTTAHLRTKTPPTLAVADLNKIPEIRAEPQELPVAPPPSPKKRRNSNRLAIESSADDQQRLRVSSSTNMFVINSVHEEARRWRSKVAQMATVSELLPLLDRLLELSTNVIERIKRNADVEGLPQSVECLEYVWNASKSAIIRWEDLKGRSSRDASLEAVQYAYATLPVFINWEQTKHLEMVDRVTLLCANTVKNWSPSSPGSRQRKLEVSQSLTPSTRTSTPSPSSDSCDKGDDPVANFCRLANISLWQNTKSRAVTGYKDDNGFYHAQFRYGIGPMLKLFCPSDVTRLKCCDEVFDLTALRQHVTENHEGPDRSEPSIEPA